MRRDSSQATNVKHRPVLAFEGCKEEQKEEGVETEKAEDTGPISLQAIQGVVAGGKKTRDAAEEAKCHITR